MKAMLLAAGYGKRLGALTKDTPKPLIEVKGKALIDYHLEKLISAGFSSVSINVHYLANKIVDHVQSKFSGKIELIFSHEEDILGTGGGVNQGTSSFGQEDILIINSDVFSDFDYLNFLDKKSNTLFVTKSKDNFSGDFSVVDGYIDIEKDKDYIWTGFSIINRSIFSDIKQNNFHYWHDCLKKIAASKKLHAEILDINWYDVGNPETLHNLNK
ncbi:MAG: nucleotidyltransferase family protein [Gammaproteobacteria bacterium]|jgi:MurNAc alpha-1-phosphate uridylyltransferase|tara:strand:+ start:3606 stop:4247 length:642 start_codon:yes stop_codon:yes gene_type:complete